MGYKTSDVAEKERLEKEGHTVIGLIGRHFDSPVYEFDFEEEQVVPAIEPEEVRQEAEPEKPRRGNPNWFNKGKK